MTAPQIVKGSLKLTDLPAPQFLGPPKKLWAPLIVDEENPECKAADAAEGTKNPKWWLGYDEENPKDGEVEHGTKEKDVLLQRWLCQDPRHYTRSTFPHGNGLPPPFQS